MRGGWPRGPAALGGGIWSMHFIAMLALILPVPVRYDGFPTVLSFSDPDPVCGAGFAHRPLVRDILAENSGRRRHHRGRHLGNALHRDGGAQHAGDPVGSNPGLVALVRSSSRSPLRRRRCGWLPFL